MTREYQFPQEEQHPSAELQHYLATHSTVNHEAVLDARFIPTQLGGFEGGKAIVWDEAQAPYRVAEVLDSAAGDSSQVQQLQNRCEAQAEANIPAVIYETLMRVGEAQRQGTPISRIFVPDIRPDEAPRYTKRLARVAQETGLPVVTPVFVNGITIYETINPPYAASAEEYWSRNPFAATEVVPQPVEIGRALEQFDAIFRTAGDMTGALRGLAVQPELTLRMVLLESENTTYGDMVDVLRAYALAEGQHVSREARSAARVVLAKIRDPECLQILSSELHDISQRRATGNETVYPLGYYLRDNKDAFSVLQGRAEGLLDIGAQASRIELNAILNVMAHADEVQCANFMAGLLALPPKQSQHYSFAVDRALYILPEIMKKAQQRVLSPEQAQVLEESETRVAHLLEALIDGRADSFKRMIDRGSHLEAQVAASIIESGRTMHQPLLRRYVLWLFEANGSLITEPLFATTYCKYRRHFGDIDEISSRIYRPPAS